MFRVTDTTGFDAREVDERFVRAAGPGGQNARQEATAVELRFDIGASSLPADVKARLMALAGRRVTTAGVLVVVSRAFRSQADNREAARARLIAFVKRAADAPTRRRNTKPRRAVRQDRLASKRFRSSVKHARASHPLSDD
jgi:ribosome-associated protein